MIQVIPAYVSNYIAPATIRKCPKVLLTSLPVCTEITTASEYVFSKRTCVGRISNPAHIVMNNQNMTSMRTT